MFAAYPFATAPFASLGSTGPVYVSTTMLAEGEAEFIPSAAWYHSTLSVISGDSTFNPLFQLLRDSSMSEDGVAEFNIHSMWNLTSTLEAKGYGEASISFDYFRNATFNAEGIATVEMAGGFKILVEALMKGSSSFFTSAVATMDTEAYYEGLSDMFAYTAYTKTVTVIFRGVGTAVISGGRIISSTFNAAGIATTNLVAVFPGDDEADFYAQGLSNMFGVGYYTAAFGFSAAGEANTHFIINALYQGVGLFQGVATFIAYGARKITTTMRAPGVGTAVFPSQYAQVNSAFWLGAGVGRFNLKPMYLFNTSIRAEGISQFLLYSQYAQVISSRAIFPGLASMLVKFTANADTSMLAVGDSTFYVPTQRILNSEFIARGVAVANMLPGNPLHQFLPPGFAEYDRGIDPKFEFDWSDEMFIDNIYKQPVERKDYDINFKAWLLQRDPEDSLDSVDYVVYRIAGKHQETSPLQIELIQLTATMAKVWVSGGSSCSTYKVELTANTVRGRRDQSEMIFIVEDK